MTGRGALATSGSDATGAQPSQGGIVRGTAFGLVADAFGLVAGLATTVMVARWLGPEGRGIFFIVVLAGTLTAMLCELGLATAALTFAAGGDPGAGRLHGLTLLGAAGGAVVAGGVFLVSGGLWVGAALPGVADTHLWIVVGSTPLLLYAQVAGAMLAGMGLIPALSLVRMAYAVVSPLVMLLALWGSGGSVTWALLAWLCGTAMLGLALGVALARGGAPPRVPSRVDAARAFGFGVRAQLGVLAHYGFLRVDALFINARLGPAATGYYSVASIAAEKMALPASAIYHASARRVGGGGQVDGGQLTARILRMLTLFLVPLAGLAALVAGPVIGLIFGHDFAPSVGPFRLLLPGVVCLVLWYIVSLYIVTGARRPGLATAIQAAALLASLPAYFIAVAQWGLMGAAGVSTGTYAIVLCLGLAAFVRLSGLSVTVVIPRRADIIDACRIAWSYLRRTRAVARVRRGPRPAGG